MQKTSKDRREKSLSGRNSLQIKNQFQFFLLSVTLPYLSQQNLHQNMYEILQFNQDNIDKYHKWQYTQHIIIVNIYQYQLRNIFNTKNYSDMNANYSYAPIRRIKKPSYDTGNKDDYDLNLRKSLSIQKRNQIVQNSVQVQKIKSNPSFSLERNAKNSLQLSKTSVLPTDMSKGIVKLPTLQRRNTLNPQISTMSPQKNKRASQTQQKSEKKQIYYQRKLQRSLTKHQTTYMMNLYRQHFYQCIEILRFGKQFKVPFPKKVQNLTKRNPGFKTIFLDLDETLIHCDEKSNNFTVKLNFPVDKGGIIAAGVRIRSYCKQFLQELSSFVEIIIFTASSASYADVILDHLDPKKELISHRLYRQHCTLEKGFYLKDLRITGRPLESCALVDNSAYCHILQPDNAIPIAPFFHFSKDRQLESLIPFLRTLVQQKDMRKLLKQTFFYNKYLDDPKDPRKVFLNQFQTMEKNLKEYVRIE